MGYATSTAGKVEWVFLSKFQTADDCDHAVRYFIGTGRDNGAYRHPAGCVYGSNSRWWSYLVNVAYQMAGYSQAGAMECLVSRSTYPDAEKDGLQYSPVTKGSPREGATYYCVM